MKPKWTALLLTGVLACSAAIPAAAANSAVEPARPPLIAPSPNTAIPDSQLYYGEIQKILKDEHGNLVQLQMHSESSGEYIMHLTAGTAWVDQGTHIAFDPADLQVGECVYVHHSPMVTLSLPPQTTAFAVVRNVQMDARCGSYHAVEAVTKQDGVLSITTDHGAFTMLVDQNTTMHAYDGSAAVPGDVKENSFVMAWYGEKAQNAVHVDHLLLLPAEDTFMTRAQLIDAIYQSQGRPEVTAKIGFADVDQNAPEVDAIRWAAAQQLMNGYDEQTFGPNDAVTLEQAVTVLWRLSNSPRLMDYTGLSQYADSADISNYAAFAMMWAHQKGLLDRSAANLEPQKTMTTAEVQTLMQTYAVL